MSWSGFKKNVGRATTQVMMKAGQVEKTSDREYEVEERRYRTLEASSLRLQKEAKGYLDSLRAMTASQMRIAETIDAFYGDSGARDGVSRSYKQAVEDLDAETVKALDGPYRTTVLEPINRFCAYFPDINECIKKRQHKMLDYDALRSKVKKLTEKPDKDPGKLPRTEKETEMVRLPSSSLSITPTSSPHHSFARRTSTTTARTQTSGSEKASSSDQDIDLSIPSPPRVLQTREIEMLKRVGMSPAERGHSVALGRSPSLSGRSAWLKSLGLALGAAPDEVVLLRETAAMARAAADSAGGSDDNANPPSSPSSPTRGNESLAPSTPEASTPTSTPTMRNPHPPLTPVPDRHRKPTTSTTSSNSRPENPSAQKPKPSPTFLTRHRHPTPFFQPSELEELMRPLKEDFLQRQADIFAQAKAAYEQLNEQLTTELPQLIDLRVPYLDPSFEALVKIQLRFCAEAYSRMAQVQQYLDASTRDQYASGDLDARVEDVLAQIRELSIAGTV